MHACTCTHQSIAELVGGEGWHSPFPRRLHVGLILLGPVRRLHLHMHARDPATARKRTDAHYSEPQARTTSDMSTGCGQRGRKLAHRSSVQGNYSMTAELEPGGGGQCVCVCVRARERASRQAHPHNALRACGGGGGRWGQQHFYGPEFQFACDTRRGSVPISLLPDAACHPCRHECARRRGSASKCVQQ
jgi:hypothetical protein